MPCSRKNTSACGRPPGMSKGIGCTRYVCARICRGCMPTSLREVWKDDAEAREPLARRCAEITQLLDCGGAKRRSAPGAPPSQRGSDVPHQGVRRGHMLAVLPAQRAGSHDEGIDILDIVNTTPGPVVVQVPFHVNTLRLPGRVFKLGPVATPRGLIRAKRAHGWNRGGAARGDHGGNRSTCGEQTAGDRKRDRIPERHAIELRRNEPAGAHRKR